MQLVSAAALCCVAVQQHNVCINACLANSLLQTLSIANRLMKHSLCIFHPVKFVVHMSLIAKHYMRMNIGGQLCNVGSCRKTGVDIRS